jgi:hypothetical protein
LVSSSSLVPSLCWLPFHPLFYQVLVCDSQRSSVEMVDVQGRQLVTVMSRQHFSQQGLGGVPTAITVDTKQRLWVGTTQGHVQAYTFLRHL